MQKKFRNPDKKYASNMMMHRWIKNKQLLVNALFEYGFGGAVTNIHPDNGFIKNPDNIQEFGDIVDICVKNDLEYWFYDEAGYPSGLGGGYTLENAPELTAKGVYMRKFECFNEHTEFDYVIDGRSDKVVYAVKYQQDLSKVVKAVLLPETAQAVPFEQRKVHVSLEIGEVIYIYIVKDAHEGSHTVHNICSRNKYINILNEKAVRRFIDVCYKPAVEVRENAFSSAKAIFTDEPSLVTAYVRDAEVQNYALLPYVDDIFECYEEKYGKRLQEQLYLLFEGELESAAQTRINFYELIAELVAKRYVGVLKDYCKQHGGVFSGHYLGEEKIGDHVLFYGNLVKVIENTGYPGMDILKCTPEDFDFNAPKFLSLVSRKMNSDGYMVELCPFFNLSVFNQNPYENIIGTLSLLYMFGAKKINTYYLADFRPYAEELYWFKGAMDKEKAIYFNQYIARMGVFLENYRPHSQNYLFYAIEDVQAKLTPRYSGDYHRDILFSKVDRSLTELADKLLNAGVSYSVADVELLAELGEGDVLILPEYDYLSEKSQEAFKAFVARGGVILQANEGNLLEKAIRDDVIYSPIKGVFLQAFKGDKETRYMLYNNNKEDVEVIVNGAFDLFDMGTGEILRVEKNQTLTLNAYRAYGLIKAE